MSFASLAGARGEPAERLQARLEAMRPEWGQLSAEEPIGEIVRRCLEQLGSEYHGPGGPGGSGELGMRAALDNPPRPGERRKRLETIRARAWQLHDTLRALDTETAGLLREHGTFDPDELAPMVTGLEPPWPGFTVDAAPLARALELTAEAAHRARASLVDAESRGRPAERARADVVHSLDRLFDRLYSGPERAGRKRTRTEQCPLFIEAALRALKIFAPGDDRLRKLLPRRRRS